MLSPSFPAECVPVFPNASRYIERRCCFPPRTPRPLLPLERFSVVIGLLFVFFPRIVGQLVPLSRVSDGRGNSSEPLLPSHRTDCFLPGCTSSHPPSSFKFSPPCLLLPAVTSHRRYRAHSAHRGFPAGNDMADGPPFSSSRPIFFLSRYFSEA